MYAVIETGGKQYRVELGTRLELDRLGAEPGSTLTIDRVLLVVDGETTAIGRPTVPAASVSAEVIGPLRGEKITVFRYRPKARRRVKKGHRSSLTVVRVTDIRLDGRSAAEDATRAEEARQTERQRLEDAAARQAAADAALAAKLAERSRHPAGDEAEELAPKRRRRAAPKAAAETARAPDQEKAEAPTPETAGHETSEAGESRPKRTRQRSARGSSVTGPEE